MNFDILLSTFNGGEYISEQLDSLLSQKDYINNIFVRDDGSTDKTLSILRDYIRRWPQIIHLIDDGKGNLGPGKSFFSLCGYVCSPFIAFCDQDDVWERTKLAKISSFISERHLDGVNELVLIHSDLSVVDQDLKLISPSFWRLMKLKSSDELCDLLIRNTVTGCACVVSKKLIDCYKPSLTSFKLHDHYYAACAALSGSIYRLDLPLVKYRQHGSNCVGVKKTRKGDSLRKIVPLLRTGFYGVKKIVISPFSYDWDNLMFRAEELYLLESEFEKKEQLLFIMKLCKASPVSRLLILLKYNVVGRFKDNFSSLILKPFNKVKVRE